MTIRSEAEVDLGLESSFSKFPVPITIDGESFYLAYGKKEYLLLSTVCPHQGSTVSDQADVFMCRDHGWRFEKTQGLCINGPRSRMFSWPVIVREGRLIVELTESE